MKKGIEVTMVIGVVVVMLLFGAGVFHSVYSQNSESCDEMYGAGNWVLVDNDSTESNGFGASWVCQEKQSIILGTEEVLGK